MMPNRWMVAAFLLETLLASGAMATPCASYGPVAHLESPRYQTRVPINVRFVVELLRQCGGVEGGPAHQFQLLEADGTERAIELRPLPPDPLCQPDTCRGLELVPSPAPGLVELRVRRPVGTGKLGSWERLSRVTVETRRDEQPPRFAGINKGSARVVKGSYALSPCQSYPGWELETRLEFEAARDDGSPHDSLLYILEREGEKGWIPVRSFRPDLLKGGRRGCRWTSQEGWGKRQTYRIRVRDSAGNETVGKDIVSVVAPPKPAKPLVEDPVAYVSGGQQKSKSSGCAMAAGAVGWGEGALLVALAWILTGCSRRIRRGRTTKAHR